MALSNVVAGNPAYASDVQQIINLLTGVMTDQIVTLARTFGGDYILEGLVAGDQYPRFTIRAGGRLAWGMGTADVDTFLYRGLVGSWSALVSDNPLRHGLVRQGGSSTVWQTSAGTTNYQETGVFIQAGCSTFTFSNSNFSNAVTVTLPVPLSDANSLICWGIGIIQNTICVILPVPLSTTQVTLYAQATASLNTSGPIAWVILCK